MFIRQGAFIFSLLLSLGAVSAACFAFTPQLNITATTDFDFGVIEAGASATGTVSMGTNGNIAYSGMFTGSPIGTAGQVTFALVFGGTSDVTLECDTSATLANAAGDTIPFINIEVVRSTSRGNFGSGTPCAGIGTTLLIPSLPVATHTIYFGGQLDLSGSLPSDGAYSTANVGGTPITVTLIRL